MLKTAKLDGVIVCIGPGAHAELAKKVMRAGLPVYTEKPPAPTAAAALEVCKVARETGQLCTTAFKKRYASGWDRAKKWVDSVGQDKLLSISTDYCSAHYTNEGPDDRKYFLLDFTVHHIDLISYLFGDAAEVFAFTKNRHAYAVSLKFTNGAVGTMNLNDGRSFSIPTEEVELTAEGGNWMTVHNSGTWKIVSNGQPSEWREPSTFTSGGDSGNDTGHLAELVDYVAALKEGRKTSRSDIFSSYRTMVLYEAIRDSAATGQLVRPAYQTV
jgi:predicted dehydrogenase